MDKKLPAFSMTSIRPLATSLGPRLETGFGTLYDLDQQNEPASLEWWDVGWEDRETSTEPPSALSVEVDATLTVGSSSRHLVARGRGECAAMRWLGCAIVMGIPATGIAEVIEELSALHRFYVEQEALDLNRKQDALPRVQAKLRPSEDSAPITFEE